MSLRNTNTKVPHWWCVVTEHWARNRVISFTHAGLPCLPSRQKERCRGTAQINTKRTSGMTRPVLRRWKMKSRKWLFPGLENSSLMHYILRRYDEFKCLFTVFRLRLGVWCCLSICFLFFRWGGISRFMPGYPRPFNSTSFGCCLRSFTWNEAAQTHCSLRIYGSRAYSFVRFAFLVLPAFFRATSPEIHEAISV